MERWEGRLCCGYYATLAPVVEHTAPGPVYEYAAPAPAAADVTPAPYKAPISIVYAATAPEAGVHFVLPAVSVAPAPAVSAAPAATAAPAPVSGASRQCLPSLLRQLQPSLLEYIAPTPAMIAAPVLGSGAHRSDSCSDHSPAPMMVCIAPAPASPAQVVEHLAPASAVLTVPAPRMEHFAPALAVIAALAMIAEHFVTSWLWYLTVQAPLKEQIAPAPAVMRSTCASGGVRPSARDVAERHNIASAPVAMAPVQSRVRSVTAPFWLEYGATARDVAASHLQAAVAAAETGIPHPRNCSLT